MSHTWSNDPADAGRKYAGLTLLRDTEPYDPARHTLKNQPWEETPERFAHAKGRVTTMVNPHGWRPTIVRSRVTVCPRPPLARRKRRSLLPELVIALLFAVMAFAVGRWAR